MKLFEEFKEDLYFYIKKMLNDIIKDSKKWFKTGMLSSEGNVEALYFEVNAKGMNPNSKIVFEVDKYRYDALFLVVTEEVLDLEDQSKIDEVNVTLKLKAYDEESEYLTEIEEDVLYKDLNEDYFLTKISEIKDEIDDIKENDDTTVDE